MNVYIPYWIPKDAGSPPPPGIGGTHHFTLHVCILHSTIYLSSEQLYMQSFSGCHCMQLTLFSCPPLYRLKKKKERKKVLHNSMNPGITKYLPQNLSAYAN